MEDIKRDGFEMTEFEEATDVIKLVFEDKFETIKVINKSSNDLPRYETKNSAGMDLKAHIEDSSGLVTIRPGEVALIRTGLFVEIPEGIEMQIRPRSGLALKSAITVLNSPGTIDPDYRGEIGVILYNAGNKTMSVSHGDRIAQAVFAPFLRVKWEEVEEIQETERGSGGFGHTGGKDDQSK